MIFLTGQIMEKSPRCEMYKNVLQPMEHIQERPFCKMFVSGLWEGKSREDSSRKLNTSTARTDKGLLAPQKALVVITNISLFSKYFPILPSFIFNSSCFVLCTGSRTWEIKRTNKRGMSAWKIKFFTTTYKNRGCSISVRLQGRGAKKRPLCSLFPIKRVTVCTPSLILKKCLSRLCYPVL